MPIINRVADLTPDIKAWRQDIHANPELMFDVHRTAAFVIDRLREFGCDEVASGIGKTGVVGVIHGKQGVGHGKSKVIGMRADMDALPIEEVTGLPYVSKTKGVMHACGHDGHTAMLLGAARYLAETRNFFGTVVLIFQPAEEIGAGARAMLDDGLMDRFGIEEVYGMHNLPGMPIGTFGISHGPVMAATDAIAIRIEGLGGHPGMPHLSIDPILVGTHIIMSLQQVLSQNVDPLASAGISFHKFQSGSDQRMIAQTAELLGSMRTLAPDVRELLKKRITDVVEGVARMTGAIIDLTIESTDAVVFNHSMQTELAISAAKDVVGEANVVNTPPVLTGEDFSYLSEARPGVFIWCGNGDSAGLHHPAYNFNDEAISYGTSFWIKTAERALG